MKRCAATLSAVLAVTLVFWLALPSLEAAVLLPDGTPDPAEPTLGLWLKADAGITQSGDLVSAWADQSAAGNDFAQASAGNQPRVIDGVIPLGSMPVVRFNGTSAYLAGPASVYNNPQSTTFMVLQANDPGTNNWRFIFDTGSTRYQAFLDNRTAPNLGYGFDAGGRIVNANILPYDGRYVVLATQANGAGSFSEIDGGGQVTGSIAGGTSGSPFHLGTRNSGVDHPYQGDIAEVLIYNRALDAAERGQVLGYLQAKYRPNELGLESAAGLAGYWDFDAPLSAFGKFNSGFGQGATPAGDAARTTATTALGAGSLALDGAGDYVTLPDMTAEFTDAGTLTMWVKLANATPTDSSKSGFVTVGNYNQAAHYPFTNGSGYFTSFLDGERVGPVGLSATVDRAEWHLVTITRDGTGADNWKLYQNGDLQQASSPSSVFTLLADPRIGRSVDGKGIEGFVDDVALFNRALGPGEVKAIYNLATEPALQFDLGQAAQLLGLYQTGTGSALVGNQQWIPFSGQYGAPGDLIPEGGLFVLQLDALGGVRSVPEPASLLLLATGGLALIPYRRRRRRP